MRGRPGPAITPLAERFWRSVDKDGPVPAHVPDIGPCWQWVLSVDRKGYGQIGDAGKLKRAHRVAFFLTHGRWPTPMAMHRCDNPRCVKAVADERGPAHVLEG